MLVTLLADAPEVAPSLWGVAAGIVTVLAVAIPAYFRLRSQVEKARAEAEKLALKHEAIADSAERKAYSDLLGARDKRIADLEKQVHEFTKTLIEQSGLLGSLKSKVEALETRSHEQDQRIGELTAENKRLMEVTAKQATELATANATIERLQSEVTTWKSEHGILMQQNEALASELKKLRAPEIPD